MNTPSEIRVINLEGSPRDRGYKHGKLLKNDINELLDRWKFSLYKNFHQDPEILIRKFVTETNFLQAVEKWTPQLLEEVKGLAEGSGIDFNTIFAHQCDDEMWWFRENFKSSSKTEDDHCSVIGSFTENNLNVITGQNVEMSPHIQGYELLLRIKDKDKDLDTYITTYSGAIGWDGITNKGLGVNCNSLNRYVSKAIDGLPVNFVVRGLLEQPNLEKAVEFIQNVKHASGQNYVISNSERIVSYECSAESSCAIYTIPKCKTDVSHKSSLKEHRYVLSPQDLSAFPNTSFNRFEYLEFQLQNPSKEVNIDTLKSILSSHVGPVCNHHHEDPNRIFTFYSLIYEYTNPPILHISVGPPCCNKYKKFKFD